MQEQIISFETAKLAKEKGFQELVSNCYYNEKLFGSYAMMSEDDSAFIDVMDGNELENHNHIDFENRFSAPTQSLLQKWLREKHNIHIEINFMSRTVPFHYGYFIILRGIGHELNLDNDSQGNYRPILSKTHGGYEIFNSYEKALEIGLQETLKLI